MVEPMQVVSKGSAQYPRLLAEIPDAPAQLYYKGKWTDHLFSDCLAVVGSRHMTSYGKRMAELLAGEAARAGVTVVSGFMYGIDATAHKAAVDAQGATIAVMPCGIERIHPEYQDDLYRDILANGGLVLSEWDGNAMPEFWTYPKRNRIVAGLSKATLVVEAGLESGSLITAELAKKYGRKVFAVPGPLTSEVSRGTAKLIQEGATLVASADDILEYYDKKALQRFPAAQKQVLFEGDALGEKVIKILRRESLEVNVLARELAISVAQLGTTLSLLELQGIIKQEGGKYYIND